jgi:hypothetical protein
VLANIPSVSPQTTGFGINTLNAWQEGYDPTNAFNPSTGVFTAPAAGNYIIEPAITNGPTSAVATSASGPDALVTNINGIDEQVQSFPLFNVNVPLLLNLTAPLQSAQAVSTAAYALNAGDTVLIQVINNFGVPHTTYGDLKITQVPDL